MSIRSAIETRLAAWASAQSVAPAIAWENVGFSPPSPGATYLRAFLLPAGRSGQSFCAIEEAGVFQVSIYTARDIGAGAAGSMAESICTYFQPGDYAGFQIQQPPSIGRGLNTDDGRYLVPVSIFYRAFP